MVNKQQKKSLVKKTVGESIIILFQQADENVEKHPDRTKRYIQMIWDLVKKHKLRLTKEQKKKFCRKCLTFFIPDKTVIVIFNKANSSFYFKCKECGYTRRT